MQEAMNDLSESKWAWGSKSGRNWHELLRKLRLQWFGIQWNVLLFANIAVDVSAMCDSWSLSI